ncbi:hypothetical protein [Rhodovulum sulfidophilum]|uniref:hypothetical protein n=1 Tax=Rhodovulum sulfidophilum TaxID=35806 RepID=UPI003075D5F0
MQEAAARLGCTASTIRRKIAAGQIEARGSGRARMARLGQTASSRRAMLAASSR